MQRHLERAGVGHSSHLGHATGLLAICCESVRERTTGLACLLRIARHLERVRSPGPNSN